VIYQYIIVLICVLKSYRKINQLSVFCNNIIYYNHLKFPLFVIISILKPLVLYYVNGERYYCNVTNGPPARNFNKHK